MKRLASLFSISLLFTMLFAGIASAHVTVQPNQTTQGAYEVFTVRVPTEKDTPTVKVEVKIPAEVAVSRFEPKPGWTYALTKDASGKITSVVWTATDAGLTSTEFGDFKMQGKVDDSAQQLTWKAYQTYKDGSVVEWTGAPDAKTPASITTVNAKPAGAATDSHGATASTGEEDKSSAESKTSLYLSIAAVILGALALITALLKRAK
jgi:uncharacterized protein YcnI